MKTYVIASVFGSKVPFRIKAASEDEALQRVFDHMGSTEYRVISVGAPQ